MRELEAHLLDAASRSPSAHNTQPWKLKFEADRLSVFLDSSRTIPAIDPTGMESFHGIGAMLENVLLTLRHLGYRGRYRTPAEYVANEPIVVINWEHADPEGECRHYRMIPIRRTSRLPYAEAPLKTEDLEALQAVTGPPCTLRFLLEPSRIRRMRELVMQATLHHFEEPKIVEELYRWTRFSRRDPGWFRDGLNAAGLGWKRPEATAARLLLSPLVMRQLVRTRFHRVLFRGINQHAPPAPCLALLLVSGDGVANRVEAGRTLQRVWLEAAARGLVTHPISAAIDHRLTRDEALEAFDVSLEQLPVNLFRLGVSAPSARSARLPVDELLVQGLANSP